MQFSKSYCVENWNGSLFSVLRLFIRFCCAISPLFLLLFCYDVREEEKNMVRAFAMMVAVMVVVTTTAMAERRWLREHGQAIWWHDRSRVCAHCWLYVYTFLLSENGGRQRVKLISCRDDNFFFRFLFCFGLWIMGSEKRMKSRFKSPCAMITL